ncbi:MAG: class II fructose-bisphosphate aldolase [Leptospirillum sp.]|jgi:fructose/tagatose bisphosphate aldolase
MSTGESLAAWQKSLSSVCVFNGNSPRFTDLPKFRKESLPGVVSDLLFHADPGVRSAAFDLIREALLAQGGYSASIEPLYRACARGEESGFTVPAINIRGLTFETAKAVFRAIKRIKGGPVIFELAKSEIGYSYQRPREYAGLIMAAAVSEEISGPVFIQGDHYQANAKKFKTDPQAEIAELRGLIMESLEAGYGNIDLDASTLVTLEPESLIEQQRENGRVTALLADVIRRTPHPKIGGIDLPVSIGGEIGEVGKENSSPEELAAFMTVFEEERRRLGTPGPGISKISVQTGTSHGGVPNADGSIAEVALDFGTLETLSKLARKDYQMGGAVQHGASTLPESLFDRFPKVGTLEIHLATGFQNLILDHPLFPRDLTCKMQDYLKEHFKSEWKSGETEAQFLYKNRKRVFGPFKKELSSLPPSIISGIMKDLEERFVVIFEKLGLQGTAPLLTRHFPSEGNST